MILYLVAASACIAAIIGYAQEPDSIAMVLCCLFMPLYVHATRSTRFRLGVAFTTVMLCIAGAAAGILAVLFWAGGSTIAAIAIALVAAIAVCVARVDVPVGVRIMRAMLRAERRRK